MIEQFDDFLDIVEPLIDTGLKQRNIFMQLFQSRTEIHNIHQAIEMLHQHNHSQILTDIEQAVKQYESIRPSNKELRKDFIENNAQYYVDLEMIGEIRVPLQDGDLPSEIVNAVNNFELHTEGLNLTLRHYQAFGAKYALIMKRTLLGDEMGLGKTIQALAVYHHLTNLDKRYCLVVCPLSVTANWKREIEKFSNHPAYIFHGNNREETFNTWQKTGGVIITTYEHTAHMNFENAIAPDFLVVDEAHFVKNKNAKRSKNVYALSELSEYVLFMSGTPLENRLDEMKQLISVLQPEIARSITQELHVLRPKDFKAHIAPVYLRRNREDVLGELPDLEVIEFWSHLSDVEERNYYQALSEGHLMNMRRAAFSGGSREASAKLDHLLDICEEAHENGHKVLVFSFFRDVIDIVQSHLKEPRFEPITGDVPNERRQEIIDEFSKSDTGSVLCLQIIAGGVGLNIQAASTIILCEPQWKPSTEVQAIGRAYRMGQTRKVIVYRLLSENTIDSTMLELLGDKAQLFDMYAKDSAVADKALPTLDVSPSEETSLQKEVMKKEQERLKVMQ